MPKYLNRVVAFDYPLPLVRPESRVVQRGEQWELLSPKPNEDGWFVVIAFGDEQSMVNMLKEGGKVKKVENVYVIEEPFS